MTSTLKKSKITIAICLILILLAGIVSLCVKSRGGDYTIKEVTISPYGSDLSFTMYIPKAAFQTDEAGNFTRKYPAIIVNEGFTEDRSCMNNVVIELVQQGFVVAQFDMYGHGRSEAVDNKGCGSGFGLNGVLAPRGTPGVPDSGYIYDAPFLDARIDDYLSRRGLMGLTREHLGEALDGKALAQRVLEGDSQARHCFREFGVRLRDARIPFLDGKYLQKAAPKTRR